MLGFCNNKDNESDKNHMFAVGLTLEHLHAQSTNKKWEPAFVGSEQELAYKVWVSSSCYLSLTPGRS